MTIRTSCSACGVKLKVDDHLQGQTVRCPGCKQPISIPAPEPAREIDDPFAEDAEAMISPQSPPPPTKTRKSTKRSRPTASESKPEAPPVTASPPRAKPTRQTKAPPETDFETPDEDEFDAPEFPNLSDEDLHGEVISPQRRKKKRSDTDLSAPVAKTPLRTTAAAGGPVQPAGWRWHLHWVLAFALLPLILSNLLGKGASLEDRLKETIESHPEINPETLDFSNSLHDITMQLPDRRLVGAWLPVDTYWHWAMALASAVFFLGVFLGMWPGVEKRARSLIVVGVTTGTLGILLLLGFQWLAFRTEGVFLRGRGVLVLLFYIVKFIGFSYRCAISSDGSFLSNFFGYTLGVGMCEELCKALPVVFYLSNPNRKHTLRTTCLIGLASGVGFGVSEGITYASEYYNGITDFWIYLVRFISCVSLHAIWAGGVAILMYSNQEHLEISWGAAFSFVAFYLLPAMILHGLYNTLLTHDFEHVAVVCAAASFVWLQWLLWRHSPTS